MSVRDDQLFDGDDMVIMFRFRDGLTRLAGNARDGCGLESPPMRIPGVGRKAGEGADAVSLRVTDRYGEGAAGTSGEQLMLGVGRPRLQSPQMRDCQHAMPLPRLKHLPVKQERLVDVMAGVA